MSKCPCGSAKSFADCCEPYLEGRAKPPTPEALMRSRYTAFTRADVDYIEKTTDPASRANFDRAGTTEWAKGSEWKGLEIVSTSGGQSTDSGENRGEVEFKAHYRFNDADHLHHERSEFRRRDDQWYFVDGRLVQEPYRAEAKVGRNDPCTCGSGKKYKKCCGKDAA